MNIGDAVIIAATMQSKRIHGRNTSILSHEQRMGDFRLIFDQMRVIFSMTKKYIAHTLRSI
jgi:hypothetical protein